MNETVRLKDGRTAEISFLSEKDSLRELQRSINALVEEDPYILANRKVTLKEEKQWKKSKLEDFRKRNGFVMIARVGGRIAGTTEARRGRYKERNNVLLGIAISRQCRGVGLGEALLRLNIRMAKRLLKPKNICICLFAANKPAYRLYRKLGFRKFAVFPKWALHKGKYLDDVFMKLER